MLLRATLVIMVAALLVFGRVMLPTRIAVEHDLELGVCQFDDDTRPAGCGNASSG